jgi:hypothetical protein
MEQRSETEALQCLINDLHEQESKFLLPVATDTLPDLYTFNFPNTNFLQAN